MNCPHYSLAGTRSIRCELLAAGGILTVAGPGNPNFPCDRCRREWIDGEPPRADRRTPTLEQFLAPDEIESDGASAGRDPTTCYYFDRVEGRAKCGCPKLWSYACTHAETPTTVTWQYCQDCEHFEEQSIVVD